jgi:DnaJ family protein A protein 2
VEKAASEADIKRAYKKLAMKHHPDRGGDETLFKDISKAYNVLSDPQKKAIYDSHGEEALNNMEQGGGGPQAGPDPFDLFSQIFGFNAAGGQQRQRGKPRTPDSTYELQVSLEELFRGTSREIVFNREAICGACSGHGGLDVKQCSTCNGTGQQVTMHQMGPFMQQVQSPCGRCGGKGYIIPPGGECKTCRGKGTIKQKKTFSVEVEAGFGDGHEFRFRGQADEAMGHDPGDVCIIVRQKPHKVFHRSKHALVMTKTLSLSEALCGFQFSTEFLDGEQLTLKSTPGKVIKPSDIMVIEGKGMPRAHGQKPGDLHLILEVDFPKEVPLESHEKLREVLGGEDLPHVEDAEIATTLSPRRVQMLKQQMAEEARGHQRGGRGGQQGVECQQQ